MRFIAALVSMATPNVKHHHAASAGLLAVWKLTLRASQHSKAKIVPCFASDIRTDAPRPGSIFTLTQLFVFIHTPGEAVPMSQILTSSALFSTCLDDRAEVPRTHSGRKGDRNSLNCRRGHFYVLWNKQIKRGLTSLRNGRIHNCAHDKT